MDDRDISLPWDKNSCLTLLPRTDSRIYKRIWRYPIRLLYRTDTKIIHRGGLLCSQALSENPESLSDFIDRAPDLVFVTCF